MWFCSTPIGLFSVEGCHQDYFSVAFKKFVALYFWQNFLAWCSFSHSLFSIRIHIMPPHRANLNNLPSSYFSSNSFERLRHLEISTKRSRLLCFDLDPSAPYLDLVLINSFSFARSAEQIQKKSCISKVLS